MFPGVQNGSNFLSSYQSIHTGQLANDPAFDKCKKITRLAASIPLLNQNSFVSNRLHMRESENNKNKIERGSYSERFSGLFIVDFEKIFFYEEISH